MIHSWVLVRAHRSGSWDIVNKALRSDVDRVHNPSTKEGVHIGAMGGMIDLVQRCYAGVSFRSGRILLDPKLPEQLAGIRMRIVYRGQWLDLHVSRQKLAITLHESRSRQESVAVEFKGEAYTLTGGAQKEFAF